MTQATDTDIREIKDLISQMREEMRVGFTDLRADMKVIDTRLIEVENKIDKQDNRLLKLLG